MLPQRTPPLPQLLYSPPKCATNTSVLADAPRFGPTSCLYPPECVEVEFSEVELPLYGVLRSSAQGGSQKSAEPRPKTYERPLLLRVLAHFAGFDIIPVIGGVGGSCVPPPCNSFQRFALGPGSSSTLLRRFERWRTEDLYDVGVTLCSGSEAIQVRWPLRVGLVSRRFAYVSVEGLAASRGLQEENSCAL